MKIPNMDIRNYILKLVDNTSFLNLKSQLVQLVNKVHKYLSHIVNVTLNLLLQFANHLIPLIIVYSHYENPELSQSSSGSSPQTNP